MSPRVPTTLHERIRALRLHFSYTQAWLANAVGVKRVTVIAWEKGERKPSGSAMMELVRVLGVSQDALETGEGFELPLLPLSGNLGWPNASSGGDLVAVEENAKAPVILPTANPGEIWRVEIGSGVKEPLSPQNLIEWIQSALDADHTIWVVTKPPGSLKTARRILKRTPKT